MCKLIIQSIISHKSTNLLTCNMYATKLLVYVTIHSLSEHILYNQLPVKFLALDIFHNNNYRQSMALIQGVVDLAGLSYSMSIPI